jgi:hypothetical protein
MRWYSIDKSLSIIEQGTVGKQEAMRIIDDYAERAPTIYEHGEDALAATMFGFCKSEAEFVEISISSADEITLTYEISIPRRILFLRYPKVIRKDRTFHRVVDVKGVVSSFFDMDASSFQNLL